jgi:surface carbohydrate biosynthesis protein
VLRLLWRVARFVRQKWNATVIWSNPNCTRIAVLDSTNVEDFIPLLGGIEYTIIDTTGRYLFITPSIFFSWAYLTIRYADPDAGYAIALAKKIRPKIILTYIDNSHANHLVSKHYRGARFLAVQNAARFDTLHLNKLLAKKIHIQEFMCFGRYEVDLYNRCGATVEKFYPVGSLKSALYVANRDSLPKAPKYDICIVAEPSPGWDEIEFHGMEDAIGNVAHYAERFAIKYGKTVCIAGKREYNLRASEELWYRKYVSDSVPIIPRVRADFTTYSLIDRSKVSVAFISSALQEGLARGNKVLYCNFTGYSKWDFPVSGVWLLTIPTFEAFEARMLQLFSMTDEEFRELSNNASKYVQGGSAEEPANEVLKKIIAEAV